jgi:hypothetical protein
MSDPQLTMTRCFECGHEVPAGRRGESCDQGSCAGRYVGLSLPRGEQPPTSKPIGATQLESLELWVSEGYGLCVDDAHLVLAEIRRLQEIEQKYRTLKECQRQAQAWYIKANLGE